MTVDALLARIAGLVPMMQSRAAALDDAARFPAEDVEDLRVVALLEAAIPARLGGLGLGTDPARASDTLDLFRLLGRGNLALGRLMEAHVNALRLVFRYGDGALCDRVAGDARAGHLCGLWVTDPPGGTLLRSGDGLVSGGKQFCSGAGFATRAVVTVADAGEVFLAYVALDEGVTVSPLPGSLAGMRAAVTGQARFDRARATVFGAAGDYLREPDFSCGAWRTSAATLGGLERLTELFGRDLIARGRGGDPHQSARFGQTTIATETARLWMREAARLAEAVDAETNDAVAYVGLARLAVEAACLDAIQIVQRSMGVPALTRGGPVERVCRDLATYLRQPAADMVLTEAAAFHLGQLAEGDRHGAPH